MTTTTARDVAAEFLAHAETLDVLAIAATDYILVYDNHLAIGFTPDFVPFATNIEGAAEIVTAEQARTMPEEAWAYTPIVKNGRGEQAKIVLRSTAAKRAAAHYRELAASLA